MMNVKTPVRMSPTNQHPVSFTGPDALPVAEPTYEGKCGITGWLNKNRKPSLTMCVGLMFSGGAAADLLFSSLESPSVRACCSMIRGYAKVCSIHCT